MRLWTLHPQYLDRRGLVALWREGLLAQEVLRGKTTGYVHHPQLVRFREHPAPLGAIAAYLRGVHAESVARGYHFARSKIGRARQREEMTATRGQLEFEWAHLMAKIRTRDPGWHSRVKRVRRPSPHPLFRIVAGPVEAWEKIDHRAARHGAHPEPRGARRRRGRSR